MSDISRAVNAFFEDAVQKDVEGLPRDLLLSERQERVFRMFYLERHDINFIADTVGCCSRVVQRDLRAIRRKLVNHWER